MKNAAITIIFNEKRDELLLVKRRDVPVWVLPGGGIDHLEKPEDAAIREAYEETGLTVEIVRKTAEYTPTNRLAALTHVFECRVIDGALQIGDETEETVFFPLNNLPKAFFIVHKHWLDEALHNKNTIKRRLTEITYFKLFAYFLKHPSLVIRSIFSRLGVPLNKKN